MVVLHLCAVRFAFVAAACARDSPPSISVEPFVAVALVLARRPTFPTPWLGFLAVLAAHAVLGVVHPAGVGGVLVVRQEALAAAPGDSARGIVPHRLQPGERRQQQQQPGGSPRQEQLGGGRGPGLTDAPADALMRCDTVRCGVMRCDAVRCGWRCPWRHKRVVGFRGGGIFAPDCFCAPAARIRCR